MNRHGKTEPADDDTRLTVLAVTPEYVARVVLQGGWPELVIYYGQGYQLAFVVEDPENAELFALGLAQAALGFASLCRSRMGGRRG